MKAITAKTAMKREMKNGPQTAQASVNGNAPLAPEPDYKMVPWKELKISPTNPRRRMGKLTIGQLAESIKAQGILEPLIIRKIVHEIDTETVSKNGDKTDGQTAKRSDVKYEIVCGERRYRAAKVAELSEVPCLIRELDDEQALGIQIHENLHREDVHPMDEAFGYKFLKEKLGCDTKELALRVGKPEGYVLNRLKLNDLIKEAQKDIDQEYLPLSYALEMAKYSPDIQKHIYQEVYRTEGEYKNNQWIEVPIKGEMVPWKRLTEWINTNIHRMLSMAPFDTKAENLRPDGLACAKCPERTGAAVSLFEPDQIGKKDACLNPTCFYQKAQTHIEVRRQELAELQKIELTEVPIVRSFCYTDGEGYLGTQSARVIEAKGEKKQNKSRIQGGIGDDRSKDCDKAVSGIDIESNNYGKTVRVCLRTTGCQIHWPDHSAYSNGQTLRGDFVDSDEAHSPEAEAAERLEAHRARREEIWNAKVAEAVRIQVFKQAAEKFAKSAGKIGLKAFGSGFLPQLIARLWRMTSLGDSNNLKQVVKPLVNDWCGKPLDQSSSYFGYNSGYDCAAVVEYFNGLDRKLQFQILFLLVHGHKGAIDSRNIYISQKDVKEVAAEFQIGYSLIDAETRLELSAKKYTQVHEDYLAAVKGKDKDAKVPRLFSQKWEPAIRQQKIRQIANQET